MDRGAQWATVHGVSKSQMWLSDWACISGEKRRERVARRGWKEREGEKERCEDTLWGLTSIHSSLFPCLPTCSLIIHCFPNIPHLPSVSLCTTWFIPWGKLFQSLLFFCPWEISKPKYLQFLLIRLVSGPLPSPPNTLNRLLEYHGIVFHNYVFYIFFLHQSVSYLWVGIMSSHL